MKPTLGRIVHYRSRTGNYIMAAVVSATVETLFRPGVDAGNVPEITDETHVHLTVFTPGLAGRVNPGTTEAQAADLTKRSTPAGGTYQEFDVEQDETGETPGSWRWPPLV